MTRLHYILSTDISKRQIGKTKFFLHSGAIEKTIKNKINEKYNKYNDKFE